MELLEGEKPKDFHLSSQTVADIRERVGDDGYLEESGCCEWNCDCKQTIVCTCSSNSVMYLCECPSISRTSRRVWGYIPLTARALAISYLCHGISVTRIQSLRLCVVQTARYDRLSLMVSKSLIFIS
jgi:hypothetical protein